MGGSMPVAETTAACPYPQAPASTVSSLLALNRTPRPQLAQESLGRDKEMGLTAQKEPAVLLAVPGYFQNWKNSCPNSLDPYLVLEGKEETVTYHTTLAS